MSKRIKLGLLFLVLTICTCLSLWLGLGPTVEGNNPLAARASNHGTNRFAQLNSRVQAAKHGDLLDVGLLTDEVLAAFALPDIPFFTQIAIKDRVTRAETHYRQGGKKGISEANVAKTVNELADKLSIPNYARVSRPMVRVVRVGLMLRLPQFIAQEPPDEKKLSRKVGSSINPLMSPLEATAVTMFLLQQKMLSRSYQVTHREFFSNIYQKQFERWQDWTQKRGGTGVTPDEHGEPAIHGRSTSDSMTGEIRRAVRTGASTMNPNDLFNLADSSLDTLGIER